MKSFVHRSMLFLAAAMLAGCALTPVAHQPAKTNGKTAAASEGPVAPVSRANAQKLGYVHYWLTSLGLPASQRITSVTQIGDVLYVTENPTPLLSAISLVDGRVLWRQLVGSYGQPLYAPISYQGKLYINSPGDIYEVNPLHGQIDRRAALPETASTGGTLLGNHAVFGSSNGVVFGLNLASFQPDWQYRLPAPITAKIATNGSDLLAGDMNGNYMLLGLTGQVIWQRKAFDAIRAAAVFLGNTVYVASSDQNLYAENLLNGSDRWIYRSHLTFVHSPVLIGGTLYQPAAGQALIALNPKTGDLQWTFHQAADPILLTDGKLLVANGHSLALLNVDSGSVFAEVPTKPLHRVIAGPDGSVILISPQGVILRLNPAR